MIHDLYLGLIKSLIMTYELFLANLHLQARRTVFKKINITLLHTIQFFMFKTNIWYRCDKKKGL